MIQKIDIPETDYELFETILGHKESLVATHSRLRAEFLRAELACLSRLSSMEGEIQTLLASLAERLGIEDLQGWRLDREEQAFIKESEDLPGAILDEPEPEPEPDAEEPEVVDPIAALRAKYGK